MTTIVNTPSQNDSSSGVGMVIGLVLVLVIGYLFFVYGLPAMRNTKVGTPEINVPSQIDVNVNQPK